MDFKAGLGDLLAAQNLEVSTEAPPIDKPIQTENESNNKNIQEPTDVSVATSTEGTSTENSEAATNESIHNENGEASTETTVETGGAESTENTSQREKTGGEAQTTQTETGSETTTETRAEETGEVTQPIVQKTLEELLTEKSQGKVKSWNEVEALLQPKEVFANDQLKNINELIKKGEVNMDEVLAYYGKDFSSMTDAETILKTQMRLSGRYNDWSDEDLTLLIDKKYERSAWSEEGEDPNTTQRLQSKLLIHDSQIAKEELVKKQEQLTIVKEPTQEDVAAQRAAIEKSQNQWNGYVENELKSKVIKLTTVIDKESNETFAYETTDAERQVASEMMKSLNANVNLFWDQFKNAEGQINHQQVYEMLLREASHQNRTKVAVKNARAEGAEKEVRASKNITLGKKKDGTPQQVPEASKAEQLMKSKGFI